MTAVIESHSTAGRWFRGLEAMTTEHDSVPLRLEGRLPAELSGTLYRNGPGRNEVFGARNGHWFDGDGMIAAFRFGGGAVTYRNRFVKTPYFVKEQAAGKMLYGGFATKSPVGFPRNLLRGMKNPANTNVVAHAGSLLACWEGGRPWSLDPETLETRGEESFGGTMPKRTFFSAHPHRDPHTGAIINVGSVMGPQMALRVWSVGAEGKAQRLRDIPLDKGYMVHDFGLTETHVALLGGPFVVDPKRIWGFITGKSTIYDAFQWRPEEGMSIFLADRAGKAPVRRYALPAAMVFHVANAFNDGADVVVDAVLYDDDGALRIVADGFAGRVPSDKPGKLWRIRLRPDGKATREPLADIGLDFTRIDERRESLPYRYTYALVFEAGDFASSKIARLDTLTGGVALHDFGPGCYAGEPVFAPRPGGRGEDDGWVLSLVYDSNDHHSFVAAVPADGFGYEDARAHLPFHTPIGFHGNWLARR